MDGIPIELSGHGKGSGSFSSSWWSIEEQMGKLHRYEKVCELIKWPGRQNLGISAHLSK